MLVHLCQNWYISVFEGQMLPCHASGFLLWLDGNLFPQHCGFGYSCRWMTHVLTVIFHGCVKIPGINGLQKIPKKDLVFYACICSKLHKPFEVGSSSIHVITAKGDQQMLKTNIFYGVKFNKSAIIQHGCACLYSFFIISALIVTR